MIHTDTLRKLARLIAAISCVCASAPTSSAATEGDTRSIRAAITLGIAQFVTYPGRSAERELTLCVPRSDTMERNFQALQGQMVSGRTLKIRSTDNAVAGFHGCDIAYVSQANAASLGQLAAMGILTLGDGDDFVARGGMIGLVQFGRQVRFKINFRATERTGIKLSSKLLRLAVQVIT